MLYVVLPIRSGQQRSTGSSTFSDELGGGQHRGSQAVSRDTFDGASEVYTSEGGVWRRFFTGIGGYTTGERFAINPFGTWFDFCIGFSMKNRIGSTSGCRSQWFYAIIRFDM